MKILYDHQIFTMQKYGGISRYFARTAVELTKLQQSVHISAPLHINKYIHDMPKSIVFGRYIEKYPFKWHSLKQNLSRLLVQNHGRSFKPDIMHETYFSPQPILKAKVPVILTVYDMMTELNSPDSPHSQWKKAAVARADHIICISEHTKSDLMSMFGVEEAKVSVVYLAHEVLPQKHNANEQGTTTKPYILYVGHRYGPKNFNRLLSVYGKSQRLRETFDLVAFGPRTKLYPEETALLSELGLSGDNVRFLTGDDDVLGGLYANAAAFVYPSLYEGFGLPPLEAMALDCPVVSTNTSSLPEVVGDAGEYFDPHSDDDMQRAIEAVVFSPTRRQELIALGRAQTAKFSWAKCASETLEVYRNVSGKR